MEKIYVVIAPGLIVLGAYRSHDSATLHARIVTGASSVPCELLDSVPDEVKNDVIGGASPTTGEWDDDDTPVLEPLPPRRPRTEPGP